MTIHVIVNPAAGGGLSPSRVRSAREALAAAGEVAVHETRGPGDEVRLAREAADAGARCVVAMGGDGTVSGVVRGLIAGERRPPLAVLAAGTGNDFVRESGVVRASGFARGRGAAGRDAAATARAIPAGTVRHIDVGIADGTPFVNAVGFGFDVAVLERMRAARGSDGVRGVAMPPRLAYVRAAAAALLGYRGFSASMPHVDRGARHHYLMIVVANGARFGGGIPIAPHALMDDGALDAVAIADLAPAKRIALFGRAMMGRHLGHPAVHEARGGAFALSFDAPPLMELDGDVRSASGRRVNVSVLPAAIALVAPSQGVGMSGRLLRTK